MMPGPTESEAPELSVVIPVYNEEENLRPLIEELGGVLEELGRRFEVICVDDCSTDRSAAVLEELRRTRPWLKLVRHTANSGESAAQATGFHHARGGVVVTMDADLQHDPHDIPRLLDALTEGVAAACGVRQKREDNWVRRLSSRIANGFRNLVTGDRISDAGCTFRAIRRDALREVPIFNGMHRFLPTILRFQGFRVVELPVSHRPRVRGQSKYGIGNRAWRGILDCLAMRWYRRRCVPAQRWAVERDEGR